VEDGKLVYRQSEIPVNTVEGSKWIFVLSTSRALYVGQVKSVAYSDVRKPYFRLVILLVLLCNTDKFFCDVCSKSFFYVLSRRKKDHFNIRASLPGGPQQLQEEWSSKKGS